MDIQEATRNCLIDLIQLAILGKRKDMVENLFKISMFYETISAQAHGECSPTCKRKLAEMESEKISTEVGRILLEFQFGKSPNV
jgi:hypothetical protein